MKEYALSVFSVCLAVGVASLLSIGGDKGYRIASSAVIIWVCLSPLPSVIGNLDNGVLIPPGLDSPEGGEELSGIAENALADGICRAVCDKFLLKEGSVRVRLLDFDMNSMSAREIRLILTGGSAAADHRAIEKYVNSLNIGKCEVEIEIG
jgi:hypothetical protein